MWGFRDQGFGGLGFRGLRVYRALDLWIQGFGVQGRTPMITTMLFVF